ncbi:hypothetical protein D3C72_1785680 [compost metagenome]
MSFGCGLKIQKRSFADATFTFGFGQGFSLQYFATHIFSQQAIDPFGAKNDFIIFLEIVDHLFECPGFGKIIRSINDIGDQFALPSQFLIDRFICGSDFLLQKEVLFLSGCCFFKDA